MRWDRRASVARGAAPCSEQSDAKQPGHSNVRAVCFAERTYSRQGSIEVRPLFQRELAARFTASQVYQAIGLVL